MKRLTTLLALVAGIAVLPASTTAHNQQQTLVSVPGTTVGSPFEDTPNTVFNWSADDWNMIRSPEDVTLGAWAASGAVLTVGAAPGPFPGTLAFRVLSDVSGNSTHSAYNAMIGTTASTTYTYSIYAKWEAGSQWATTRIGSGYCAFNVATGAAGSCLNGATGGIQSVGNGWWRIWSTATSTGATVPTYAALVNSNGTSMSFAGDGASSILFYGPNVVRGTLPLAYKPPLALNQASSPSAFDSATGWVKYNSGGVLSPVVTADQAVAPNGTKTADRIDFPAISNASHRSLVYGARPQVASGLMRWSVKVKAVSGSGTVWLGLTDNVTRSGSACAVNSTTWTTCSATAATNGSLWYWTMGPDALTVGAPSTQPAFSVYAAEAMVTNSLMHSSDFSMSGDTAYSASNSSIHPRGFGGKRAVGGPSLTDTNHFTFGANNDVTDFTGDFSGCAVVQIPLSPVNGAIFGDGIYTAPSQGWYIDFSNPSLRFVQNHGQAGTFDVATGTGAVVGARNVVCFGRSGLNIYSKVNGGTTGTAVADAIPAWTTGKFLLGRAGQAGYNASLYVEEVWLTTNTWSEQAAQEYSMAALLNGGSGPSFPGGPGTVLHIRGDAYDGTVWRTPQGLLTRVGTGTIGYTDAWAPTPVGLARAGYGPFTTTQVVTSNSVNDPFDFNGDFTVCALFTPSAITAASTGMIVSASTSASAGWDFGQGTNGTLTAFPRTSPGTSSFATTNAMVVGLNVGCFGRSGNLVYLKLNGGPTNNISLAGTAMIATNGVTVFGRLAFSAANNFLGQLHAVWASLDTWDETAVTAIQNRVLGNVTATGAPIANSRSTSSGSMLLRDGATGALNRGVPPSSLAIEGPGIGIWRQSTNMYLYSSSFCTAGNVTQSPWVHYSGTCVNDATTGPDGQPADQYTQAGINGGLYVSGLSSPASLYGVSSVYGRKVSGTGMISAMVQCAGQVITCSCARDDGGACTPIIGLPTTNLQCSAKASIESTRWVRLSAIATCLAPTTSWTAAAYPGEVGVSTADTAYLTGLSVEAGPWPTPLIPTTTATAQRNADVVTVPSGLLPGDADWCATGTYDLAGRPWTRAGTYTLWSIGASGANAARAQLQDGRLLFNVTGAFWNNGQADLSMLGVATGPHTVKTCASANRLAIYLDGKLVQGSSVAQANYVFSVPSPVATLGADGAGANQLDGFVRDFAFTRWNPTMTDLVAIDAMSGAPFTLTAVGNWFAESANTVAHWTWNGTAIQDSKGNGFYPSTSAPSQIAASLLPCTTCTGAASFLSSAGRYTNGLANDQFDVANFQACVSYIPPATGAAVTPIGNGNGTTGYLMQLNASGYAEAYFGATLITTTNLPQQNGLNVTCFGRNGTTGYVKTNNGTTATAVVTTSTDTARAFVVGAGSGGTQWFTGKMVETIFENTGYTENWAVAQMQRHFGQVGAKGDSATVARTQVAGVTMPSGTHWVTPAGFPAIGKYGLETWPASTQYVTQSEDLTAAGWATTGTCAVTANQGPAPWTDLEKVDCTGSNTDNRYFTATLPSTTGPVTICSTVAAVSGIQGVSLVGYANGAASSGAVTCWRSDGGPCATTTGASPFATALVSTSPIRLCMTWSAATAQTSWMASVQDGVRGTSTVTGGTLFGRVTLDIGVAPPPYCPGAGSTCVRTADTFVVGNDLRSGNNAIQSDDFGTTWAPSAATIQVNTQADPLGGNRGDTLTANAGSTEHGVGQTPTGLPNPGNWSVYAKAGTHRYMTMRGVSGTRKAWFDLQTCTVLGTTTGTTAGAIPSINGWCRVWYAGDFSSSFYNTFDITDSSGNLTFNAAGTETIHLFRGQASDSGLLPQPVATTTTAQVVDHTGGNWCVCGQYTSYNWTDSTQRDMWGVGAAGAANTTRTYCSSTTCLFQTWDNAVGSKYVTATHGLTGQATTKVASCNAGGTLSVYFDGVLKSGAATGAGTGVITTWPGYIHVGSVATYGEQWKGAVSDFKMISSSDHTQCGPGY